MQILFVCLIFYYLYGDPRDLPVLTHSFPTRRSSDLGIQRDPGQPGARRPPGRGHPPAGQPPGPLRRIWRLWQRPANLRPLRVYEIDQLTTPVDILPPIFLRVAAFLLNILLASLVETEREFIALLKAFGFSPRPTVPTLGPLPVLVAAP